MEISCQLGFQIDALSGLAVIAANETDNCCAQRYDNDGRCHASISPPRQKFCPNQRQSNPQLNSLWQKVVSTHGKVANTTTAFSPPRIGVQSSGSSRPTACKQVAHAQEDWLSVGYCNSQAQGAKTSLLQHHAIWGPISSNVQDLEIPYTPEKTV